MQFYKDPAYRRVVFIGLLFQLLAAWFSVGYHYPDEHFQVYELCNYKLGFSPAADLPWEFNARIRSGLQPLLVYGVAKLLLAVDAYNPFTIVFLFRLLMGVFTWLVTCRVLRWLLPELATQQARKLFVWCSFLLWFIPYIGVRFSAENFAGLLFLLALTLFVPSQEHPDRRHPAWLGVAGLLFGFALYMRLQMGFAFVGLALWVLIIYRPLVTELALLVLGGLAAIGLSVVADHWLYGAWVFPPYNYYYTQIVQNIAAKWGVQPWWYYFRLFFESAVPPISIALLLLFFKGLRYKWIHILGISTITFVIGHMMIGHKELRFLFPATLPMIFLAMVGADTTFANGTRRWHIITFRILATLNIALLLFKSTTPAQEVASYFRYIYNYAGCQPTTLVSLQQSPYNLDRLEANFYKPKSMPVKVVSTVQGIDTVAAAAAGTHLLYLTQYVPGQQLPGYNSELLYCIFPSWLLKINVNNWQERSRIWAIYRLTPVAAQH